MASSQGFDLILMDIMMPIMDGLTASKTLRERSCEVPILALTATALEDQAKTIQASGMNDVLLKPFRPDDLEAKIRDYVPAA